MPYLGSWYWWDKTGWMGEGRLMGWFWWGEQRASEVEEMDCGKRIHKESSYVRHIWDGGGSATNLPSSHALPLGLQIVTEQAGVADCCIMPAEEDFTIATVMTAAEDLEPFYNEAKQWLNWPKWEKAVKMELALLEENGTWKLVECPTDTNVVDLKWVLRIKKNAAGEIDKYKAWLVVQGFMQVYGVNYHETYALVACLASFHFLITSQIKMDGHWTALISIAHIWTQFLVKTK